MAPRPQSPPPKKANLKAPDKYRILGAIQYAEATGQRAPTARKLAEAFGVTISQARRVKENGIGCSDLSPSEKDPRGRNKKISPEAQKAMLDLIQSEGWGGYERLQSQLGLGDLSHKTIRKGLQTAGVFARNPPAWQPIDADLAAARVSFAIDMLERFPTPEHWRKVRFSDEGQIGYQSHQTVQARRIKPQTARVSKTPKQDSSVAGSKRLSKGTIRCWAAVGFGFKSDLIAYTMTGSKQQRMTQNVYKTEILGTVVRGWIDAGDEFILEEDNEPGHGPDSGPMQVYKQDMGLVSYVNCARSPDLTPFGSCWDLLKQDMADSGLAAAPNMFSFAQERWRELDQTLIDRWVDSMPQRLQAVIDAGGQLGRIHEIVQPAQQTFLSGIDEYT